MIFIDRVHVQIRDGQVANRPICVALASTADGGKDVLGLWAGDGGAGAKYWLRVRTELRNRGVADACIVVCDGSESTCPTRSVRCGRSRSCRRV